MTYIADTIAKINANAVAVGEMPEASKLMEAGVLPMLTITADQDRWGAAQEAARCAVIWLTVATTLRVTLGAHNTFSPINPDNNAAACEIGAIEAVSRNILGIARALAGRNGVASEETMAAMVRTDDSAEIIDAAHRAIKMLGCDDGRG